MRYRAVKSGMTVNVIAGTYVVFFGFDLQPGKLKGLRGFALKRTDPVDGETVWLRGMKTFEKTAPHPAVGETFATRDHPIQGFQWADYSAKPGRTYLYTVEARYGDAASLKTRMRIEIEVSTEAEIAGDHSVFFNRGSVATQEYARRYQNKKPSEAGPGAYAWLSRGLLEALIAYLGQARQGWSIHAAVYEFEWPEVLKAVKKAKTDGADVHVIYDGIEAYKGGKPAGPWQRNADAVAAAKIKGLCKPRRNGKLMHNKFFVLSHNGKPVSVWTGSTNLTENGIFGHSNVGHIVRDRQVAQAYLDYWHRLAADPEVDAAYREENMQAGAAPPDPWERETVTVFSPRGTELDSLAWYAQLAAAADKALLMTFAFGMHPSFVDVYRQDDDVLRMALMETIRRSPQTAAQDERDIQAIRARANVVVAVGNRIPTNSFDRWLQELSRLRPEVHVYWIHTKYMLLDPLGEAPIVVTGSANFSKASTDTNDENMLVIRGNKRVADIYFGEFQRLYSHYAFREAVKRALERGDVTDADRWKPQYLVNDDTWTAPYFDPDDKAAKSLRRKYFAGPLAL